MKNKVPVKPSEKDEETNKSLRLIAKTSMIVFIGVMLSRILGYAYRVIVARYFGAETYGLFSLAIMVLGIFSAFASLGLAEGIVRYGAFYRARGENKKLFLHLQYFPEFYKSFFTGDFYFYWNKKQRSGLFIFYRSNCNAYRSLLCLLKKDKGYFYQV